MPTRSTIPGPVTTSITSGAMAATATRMAGLFCPTCCAGSGGIARPRCGSQSGGVEGQRLRIAREDGDAATAGDGLGVAHLAHVEHGAMFATIGRRHVANGGD